jgi:hypothetical protein
VVGIDGSQISEAALAFAFEALSMKNAHLPRRSPISSLHPG